MVCNLAIPTAPQGLPLLAGRRFALMSRHHASAPLWTATDQERWFSSEEKVV
jgi:hypothetical protein